MTLLFSSLGCILSLSGNFAIIFKMRIGFWLWTVGNAAWIVSAIVGELNIPLIAMNVVYAILNVIGYFKWRKKENDNGRC